MTHDIPTLKNISQSCHRQVWAVISASAGEGCTVVAFSSEERRRRNRLSVWSCFCQVLWWQVVAELQRHLPSTDKGTFWKGGLLRGLPAASISSWSSLKGSAFTQRSCTDSAFGRLSQEWPLEATALHEQLSLRALGACWALARCPQVQGTVARPAAGSLQPGSRPLSVLPA